MDSDAQLGSGPSATGVRLIGRARECAVVDGLIGAIRKGGSASLIVTGEPGIGKSSLLAYGVQAAGADTMVLMAKGIRAEEDIPFAALAQLRYPPAAAPKRTRETHSSERVLHDQS
jgi:hypothetical protein